MSYSVQFDGEKAYFLHHIENGNFCVMGTCNADSHWDALAKFKDGFTSEPMIEGDIYELCEHVPKIGSLARIRFVY